MSTRFRQVMYGTVGLLIFVTGCATIKHGNKMSMQENTTTEVLEDRKLTIYQLLVRHLGNQRQQQVFYGSLEENGVGKFQDIDDKALEELADFGISHVWYTGVIAHATMTDYTAYGVHYDDPDVVKGRAGSPYAIKDYYDVDPDLAVNVGQRMQEYEALIARTHRHGLKVLMDFIPNHVARTYVSKQKPEMVEDLGEKDDASQAFSPKNDFYYKPQARFDVPKGYDPGGPAFQHPLKDGKFEEVPERVTGNDVFHAKPTLNDWFETIKLNYGVDYVNGKATHFDPIPPLWNKMRDILLFWAGKGTDGFRCDMAEMVPVEFWQWVIPAVKKQFPDIIFIAEIYNPQAYRTYLDQGHFDYLYDKVGLYDGLRKLVSNAPDAHVDSITRVWKEESKGFSQHMLRFMENHDEQRIASRFFAGNPWFAKPAMVISATLSSGPLMIYSGQEVGEPAAGATGFSGDDGRTSIFDYIRVPQVQKWANGGAFDGGQLNSEARSLRDFYGHLLRACKEQEAIRRGNFFELLRGNTWSAGFNGKTYAFVRYTEKQRLLIVANFDRVEKQIQVYIPDELIEELHLDKQGPFRGKDLLSDRSFEASKLADGISIPLVSTDAVVLSF